MRHFDLQTAPKIENQKCQQWASKAHARYHSLGVSKVIITITVI